MPRRTQACATMCAHKTSRVCMHTSARTPGPHRCMPKGRSAAASTHASGFTHARCLQKHTHTAAWREAVRSRPGPDLSEIVVRAQVVDELRELRDEAAPELRPLRVRDRREACQSITPASQRLGCGPPVSVASEYVSESPPVGLRAADPITPSAAARRQPVGRRADSLATF